MNKRKSVVYAFIDASNLFYGGKKSLGWKIDYKKLLSYLKQKYGVNKAFYYGGVETYGFEWGSWWKKPGDLMLLQRFLLRRRRLGMRVLERDIQRVKFYRKLKEFGYRLRVKMVKTYRKSDGSVEKKANCDVDMTFEMIKLMGDYSGVVVLSGDGDFAVVLAYLQKEGKRVTVLARGERTSREIRQLVGSDFRDFNYLRELLRFDNKKRRLV